MYRDLGSGFKDSFEAPLGYWLVMPYMEGQGDLVNS